METSPFGVTRSLRRLPLVEQTAAYLREGFQSGRWSELLPGVLQLAADLMVGKRTVRAALVLLEQEGWIESCGVGRRRKIATGRIEKSPGRTLRIGVMLYAPLEEEDGPTISILLGIKHAIETQGHASPSPTAPTPN